MFLITFNYIQVTLKIYKDYLLLFRMTIGNKERDREAKIYLEVKTPQAEICR